MSQPLSKTTMESIEFRGLDFGYESTPVLQNASFTFPMGRNVVIQGVSGTGRSTVLKILAGLILPSSGQYLLNGQDVTQMSFEEFLPFRKRIGYSCDFGGLMANRTLWDNLMLPLMYHNDVSPEEAEAHVTSLVHSFGLWNHRDKRPAAVSGSMRKASVVARAFVMKPEMLLLDDPTIALDPHSLEAFFALVHEYRRLGIVKHVFVTTRDESVIEQLDCQSVFLIDGRLVPHADPERKVASL